ncbi:MAG: hypothetical protein RL199_1844 [Pseudomonadota bacterium]|jgi:hypothetical protein
MLAEGERMTTDIEELRRQKERLDREREALERQLAEAERREREKAADLLVRELRDTTARIDALKGERVKLLARIREVSPRHGDFTYAAEDDRLALGVARSAMKQPELFDKLMAALEAADFHVEPRAPRFRLFRGLRPVGTLQLHPKRIGLSAVGNIIDGDLLSAATEAAASWPGLVHVTWDATRRVRAGVPGRPPDGRFATGLSASAGDTGSLDVVLPLLVRALDHIATYLSEVAPADESRLFEDVTPPSADPGEERPSSAA